MKVRHGFVSNSSSSSFVIIRAGRTTIVEDGDTDMEICGGYSIPIDTLISALTEAKSNGETIVTITHGGGYNG